MTLEPTLTVRSDYMSDSIAYPEVTTVALPESAAQLYGDQSAFVFGDEVVSYAEFGRLTGTFASGLRNAGVRHGDVVLIHMSNCIDFVVGYFGSIRAGATVSLTNPMQPVAGLHHQLLDTAANVVLTQRTQIGNLFAAAEGTSVDLVVVDDATWCAEELREISSSVRVVAFGDVHDPSKQEFTAPDSVGEDLAHIAYTGGTTGVSKGVIVRQRNIVANLCQTVLVRCGRQVIRTDGGLMGFGSEVSDVSWGVDVGTGVSVVVSPLFHAHALIALNTALMTGNTTVFAGRFDPANLLDMIEQYRVSIMTGSPAMWHALTTHAGKAERDLSSMRVVTSGAAPMDSATREALRCLFPAAQVGEGYGMTEATAVVTMPPLAGSIPNKDGSVGVPVFDTEFEVRAWDGSGTVLAPETPGVLWVRGPQVTDGYLGQDEDSAQQFVDGWLDTGDVGYVDDDGFIFISDRIKDMLIYKGYNIYPRELEEILISHPDVIAAAVVGRSSDATGQEPVGFVVLESHCESASTTPKELIDFVAERVLPYKKLRDVVIVDAFPTSAAGKVLKTELRMKLEARANQ